MDERLTAEQVRELLDYDSETGVFRWKVRTSPAAAPGDRAGSAHGNAGYWRIQIKGRTYKLHRIAWLYAYGAWPEHQIDHINLDRGDNRLSNLREATHGQNSQNRTHLRYSTSHLKGAHRDGRKWRARIRLGGRNVCLGRYDTAEQAHEAYMAAARKHFGEFARAA